MVKSLPSLPLVRRVMELADTRRLMIFDLSFLDAVARGVPGADVLFGKPMPAVLAARFYDEFASGTFDPARHVHWLIDTPQRPKEYARLAEERGLRLKVNIEIDVGLHRGGVTTPAQLAAALHGDLPRPRIRLRSCRRFRTSGPPAQCVAAAGPRRVRLICGTTARRFERSARAYLPPDAAAGKTRLGGTHRQAKTASDIAECSIGSARSCKPSGALVCGHCR